MSVPVGRGRRGEHLHARPPGLEDVDVRTRPKLRPRDGRAVVGDAPFTLLGLLIAVLKLNVSDEGGNQGCHQRLLGLLIAVLKLNVSDEGGNQ